MRIVPGFVVRQIAGETIGPPPMSFPDFWRSTAVVSFYLICSRQIKPRMVWCARFLTAMISTVLPPRPMLLSSLRSFAPTVC